MDVSVCRRAAWAGGWCLSHLIILDGAFSSAISPLMLTEHYGWVHQMVFAGVTLLNSTVKPTAQKGLSPQPWTLQVWINILLLTPFAKRWNRNTLNQGAGLGLNWHWQHTERENGGQMDTACRKEQRLCRCAPLRVVGKRQQGETENLENMGWKQKASTARPTWLKCYQKSSFPVESRQSVGLSPTSISQVSWQGTEPLQSRPWGPAVCAAPGAAGLHPLHETRTISVHIQK